MDQLIDRILKARAAAPSNRSLLVGISGIDGSGKGYVTKQIEARLGTHAVASAVINVDGWLNLPEKRFNLEAPAAHFYDHAIRFDPFFSELVLPLRDRRSVHLVADHVAETATQYRKHVYSYKNVAVVLVEGIFIFKTAYRSFFDLAIWLDCSFPTALARAIERSQEDLAPAQTIAAYETIYFPAQRIHLAKDDPRGHADFIFENDVRISLSPRPTSVYEI
jgi:uridine kinase